MPGETTLTPHNGHIPFDAAQRTGDPLVPDRAANQRLPDLLAPPACENEWICPAANGHIQAAGTYVGTCGSRPSTSTCWK